MDDHKKRGGFGGGNRGGGFGGFKGGRGGGGFGGGSGGYRGGGSSFGGGSRSKFSRPGNHEFRKAQMFSATCAECGKPCEVPFRPTGDKPVFCSYCFGKNRVAGGVEGAKSFAPAQNAPRKDFGAPSYSAPRPEFNVGQMSEIKKQIEMLSAKIDNLIMVIGGSAKNAISKKDSISDVSDVSETATKPEKKVSSAKKSPAKKK